MKKYFIIFVSLVTLGLIFWSCSDDGGTSPDPDENTLSCVITSPVDSTGFFAGDTITVIANADDTEGSISEVRFLIDNNGVSSDQEFPYSAKIPTDLLVVGSHEITAIAENDKGKELESNVIIGIKPDSPTNLIINQLNVYTFKLTWSYNSEGEDGFIIERKIDGGDFVEIATLVENTYTDSTVSKKGFSTVYYQVKAFKEIYSSDYVSNHSTVGFPAPGNLTYSKIDLNTIQLDWNDLSNGEDGFKIDKKVGDGDWVIEFVTLGENTVTWIDNNAEINQNIQYRIYGFKDTNSSGIAETPIIDNSIPVPTNFNITQYDISNAEIIWTDNSIGEDKFTIERKLSTDSLFAQIHEVTGDNTASKTWTDNTVEPGLIYDYRIRCSKDAFESDYVVKLNYNNLFQAPSNLSVVQNNVYTFTLNWTDNSNGEDGFKIERKIDDGSFIEIALVTGTNYVDDSVSKGFGTVYYQVRAFKDTYNSAYATQNSSVVFPAPTNLSFSKINLNTIKLDWLETSNGEDGFRIDKKVGASDWILGYASVGENIKTYTDISAEINENLEYRIYAFKDSNTSSSISKSIDNTFPAPTILTVIQNNVYTFSLNWSDNSTGEEGFRIERKIDDGTYSEIASTTSTSFVDSTVSKKGYSTVYYQVRAYKDTYYSSYAVASSSVTFPAPTGLNYSKEDINTIKLDWIDNSTGEDGFKIDKKVGTAEWIVEYATVSSNIITWTDSNAEINEDLIYRIYAFKGFNASSQIETSLIDNTIPAPTSLIIAQTSIGETNLTWSDNSIGEDKFEIERKLSADPTFTKVGEVTGDNNTLKIWNDTNFVPTETYDYRIKAVKGTHSSQYVEILNHNTFPSPTNLIPTEISASSIMISWSDNNDVEEGYSIDRKDGDAGAWQFNFTSVGSNITEWTDTGLLDETRYFYRVRAYSSSYYSTYSNEANTVPAPLGLVFVPSGSYSMGQPDPNIGDTNWSADEQPVHDVNITQNFYIGKHEVTQKEWFDIMGTNPSSGFGIGDDFPVYYVSWFSTIKYCNLLSMNEGLTPCYTISASTDPADWGQVPYNDGSHVYGDTLSWNAVTCNLNVNGYRLATESEWEYAAKYNDGRTYPWGNENPSNTLCNYNSDVGLTTPVCSYPEGNSNLGISDMAGNIREWVWDRWVTYPSAIQTDPLGSTTGRFRVLRGGGWRNYNEIDNYKIRCTARYNAVPYYSGIENTNTLGFRIARTK